MHERALTIVYKNSYVSFDDLLKKDGSFAINHRNSKTSSIDLFKIKNGFTSEIINIFEKIQIANYKLRSQTDFLAPSVRTSHYGLNSLLYFADEVWDIVTDEIENLKDLDELKMRDWESKNYHCKFCRVYLHNVEYIDWAILCMTYRYYTYCKQIMHENAQSMCLEYYTYLSTSVCFFF